MLTKWSPAGIADFSPSEIGPTLRSILQDQAAAHGLSDLPESFFEELGMSIGRYHSAKTVAAESSPAIVRKNLQRASKNARDLADALSALDVLSSSLLFNASDISATKWLDRVMSLSHGLDEAHNNAKDFPSSGRLPDFAKLFLAIDVSRLIESTLKRTASTTRSGLFESILTIVLEDITQAPIEDINDLVAKAIAMRNSN